MFLCVVFSLLLCIHPGKELLGHMKETEFMKLYEISMFCDTKLKDGGKASQAHVRIGDVVLSIDGISAHGMTHLEAQNKIKGCTGSLNMTLQRASAAAKPEPVAVQKKTHVT
ncbi:hypothetical protein STEG23_031057, partial [Scotinomys teguina]